MMKPNCYKCLHRGTLPGDVHSRCRHPALGEQDDNPFGAMAMMFTGQAGDVAKKLHVTAQPHGIRMGWFMWPVNFDPAWLITCDGFTPKESEHAKDT